MATTIDRVRSLIDRSGLSQRAFADRIGLDDSKLSKSLSGARRFSSLDLARIAEAESVSVDWLLTGAEPGLSVAARVGTTASVEQALLEARRLSTLRRDVASLGYPQPWRPLSTHRASGGYAQQGARLAELAAQRCRETGVVPWDPDLSGVIEEAFGADVAIADLGRGFDGLSVSGPDVKLILVARSGVAWRQRFTLAHELGHLLADDDQDLHVDQNVFDAAHRREPSEQRANAFAAAWLMPVDRLATAVGENGLDQQRFAQLAYDLRVSPSALSYRLLGLRLIDSGRADTFKALTARDVSRIAGRPVPAGGVITAVSRPPGLLARDTYAAFVDGRATLRPHANVLGVGVDELSRDLGAVSEDDSW